MEKTDKMIDVKNLKISFKTNNGTVKAVRDISFSLNKGETLAIVGESGSGKSVTARAIMGILAGNAITEGGEIFFDGQDLTKITEESFHKIRGNKISMIFQDPFSSLNPIVRIGTQLTEAMLLNGKANRRAARRDFNKRLKLLEKHLPNPAGVWKTFDAYSKLEKAYQDALENITIQLTAIDGVLIDLVRGEPRGIVKDIRGILKNGENCCHDALVKKELLQPVLNQLEAACPIYLADGNNTQVKALMTQVRELLAKAIDAPPHDFFMASYQAHMKDAYSQFLAGVEGAVKASGESALKRKQAAAEGIDEKLPLFDSDAQKPAQYKHAIRELVKLMEASIDPLAIHKDSFAYAFRHGCGAALDAYLNMRKLHEKNELHNKKKSYDKNPADTAAEVADCRENLRAILIRARDAYKREIENAKNTANQDYAHAARQTVERLKSDAAKMVQKVSKSIAKSRAISLMEEVGIPEARARYRQYPFQFSGGMRQRIVIAIALAANPDLLICDEPTTALDVTIQAQILDLINRLKEKRGISVIFITHDLGVVANVADHIAVMYAGKIVEEGTVNDVFFEPAHPYTWALLASMPDLDTKEKLDAIPGTPPNMIHPPVGDAFAARNKYAMEIDFEQQPPFFEISPTHKAATWLLHPSAPKAAPPKIVTERIKRMKMLAAEDV